MYPAQLDYNLKAHELSCAKKMKGCKKFLFEEKFYDPEDLFDHDVVCGGVLVKDGKVVFCDECLELNKNAQKRGNRR